MGPDNPFEGRNNQPSERERDSVGPGGKGGNGLPLLPASNDPRRVYTHNTIPHPGKGCRGGGSRLANPRDRPDKAEQAKLKKQRVEIELSGDEEDLHNDESSLYYNSGKPDFTDDVTTNESSTKKFNLVRRGGSGFSSELSDKEFRSTLMAAKKKFLSGDTLVEIDISDDDKSAKKPKEKFLPRGGRDYQNRDSAAQPNTAEVYHETAGMGPNWHKKKVKEIWDSYTGYNKDGKGGITFDGYGGNRNTGGANQKYGLQNAFGFEDYKARLYAQQATLSALPGQRETNPSTETNKGQLAKEATTVQQPESTTWEKPTFYSEEKFMKLVSGVYKGNPGSSNRLNLLIPSDRPQKESFASRYEILETLGEGGSCVVRKVIGKKDNKVYAIKSSKNYEQDTRSYIKRELKMLRMTTHPCIIKSYGLFSSNTSVDLPQLTLDSPCTEVLRGGVLDQNTQGCRHAVGRRGQRCCAGNSAGPKVLPRDRDRTQRCQDR